MKTYETIGTHFQPITVGGDVDHRVRVVLSERNSRTHLTILLHYDADLMSDDVLKLQDTEVVYSAFEDEEIPFTFYLDEVKYTLRNFTRMMLHHYLNSLNNSNEDVVI